MKKILSFISFLCMMGYCADIAYAEETSDVPVETTVTGNGKKTCKDR